jgi:hypothetical protein
MTTTSRLQEIFNVGYLGVLKQGKPSLDPAGEVCQFLTPEGSKCVIGFSLTKAQAQRLDKMVNGGAVNSEVINARMAKALKIPPEGIGPIRELQECHDDVKRISFIPEFTRRAKAFAMEYGLTIPDTESPERAV